MWSYVLIGVAIIVFILFFLRLSQNSKEKDIGPFFLEKKPQIATVDDAQTVISKSNTGSFQVFVFPNQIQKTGQISKCTEDGIANPGDPDCSTGKYHMCPCIGSDCSRCRHLGYLNILNISNTIRIELLTAPDASRQKSASTQMIVRTLGTKQGKQTYFEETIILPDLPYQKWTMITIAREGRRYDVYYNDKLVMSKRTQFPVDSRVAYSSIVAGDPDLYGKVALVETFPQKLNLSDIVRQYQTKATTTGEPIFPTQFNAEELLPLCKDGSCIKGPVVKPPTPLMDWETKYA